MVRSEKDGVDAEAGRARLFADSLEERHQRVTIGCVAARANTFLYILALFSREGVE